MYVKCPKQFMETNSLIVHVESTMFPEWRMVEISLEMCEWATQIVHMQLLLANHDKSYIFISMLE